MENALSVFNKSGMVRRPGRDATAYSSVGGKLVQAGNEAGMKSKEL